MTGTYSICCPTCNVAPLHPFMGPSFAFGSAYPAGFGPAFGFGLSAPGWWGGAYPQGFYGPTFWGGGYPTDEQMMQMIYDAIDADQAIPYDVDVNVDVTGGVVTLTGTVSNKRVKHAAGDDAWWVPGVWDINNNLEIAQPGRAAERAGQ